MFIFMVKTTSGYIILSTFTKILLQKRRQRHCVDKDIVFSISSSFY